jgi:hypothetical protein
MATMRISGGKNSLGPAGIEILHPVGIVLTLDEDGGDEESRQDKKQFYAHPARLHERAGVMKKNKYDGEAADAVQRA